MDSVAISKILNVSNKKNNKRNNSEVIGRLIFNKGIALSEMISPNGYSMLNF